MASLLDITETIAKNGYVSAAQLSQLLKIKPSLLEGMLWHLIRLEKIEKVENASLTNCQPQGCKGCHSTSCATPPMMYAIKSTAHQATSTLSVVKNSAK